MARNEDSIPVLLIKLPWWVSILFGLAAYAGIRWGVPHFMAGDRILNSVALGIAKLAPLVALFFLLLAGLSVFYGRMKRRLVDQQSSLESLHAVSWQQFEWMVAEAYRRLGFSAEESLVGGPDGGVDVVLRKSGQTIFVQCKQWKNSSVGSPIIRDLYGAVTKAGASRGIVITSGRFTREAQDFAEGIPIELVDGEQLLTLLQGVQRPKGGKSIPSSTPSMAISTPVCPKCGATMMARMAKRGANTGKPFWGCSTYPTCKAILPRN